MTENKAVQTMLSTIKRLAAPLAGVFNNVFFTVYYRSAGRRCYRLDPLALRQPRRLLVLAPHVDDEVIGLGGLLASLPAAGHSVRCVYMTNGAASYHPTLGREALIGARREEGRRVAELYGLEEPVFLDYEDGELGARTQGDGFSVLTEGGGFSTGTIATANTEEPSPCVVKVAAEIRKIRAEALFIPYFLDGHPDHVATTAIALDALAAAGVGGNFPLFLYQVNSPLTAHAANRYVPLDGEAYCRKVEALALFRSQTLPFSVFLGLDRCRQHALPQNKANKRICAAEFFRETDLQDCRATFDHFGPGIHRWFEQIRSPYGLIVHFFSGWRLKKQAGRLWPR